MTNDIITLDKNQLEQINQLANDMSRTALAIPKHLQGNPAACKAIVRNSLRWQMDPYLVAQESSDIRGKLMYSGKLVNAVVSEDPRLEFPLNYEFEGMGEQMVCTVFGRLKGEEKPRKVRVPMPPQNKRVSDHWKTNPEQQLSYYAARVWTRRHLPGKLLGVWTPDDPVAAAYTPQKETNNIMENVVNVANNEDPVIINDDDAIDAEVIEVPADDMAASEVHIRLIKSDGSNIDFGDFQSWLDFIKENLAKMKDLSRLETFEQTHRPIFQEYVHAGYQEWANEAIACIMENKQRLEGAHA